MKIRKPKLVWPIHTSEVASNERRKSREFVEKLMNFDYEKYQHDKEVEAARETQEIVGKFDSL